MKKWTAASHQLWSPEAAKFSLFFFLIMLVINAMIMLILSSSTYFGTGPWPGQKDLFPNDLLLALAILGSFNFLRSILLCFCAFRMSAFGLLISTTISIPYVAAHLVLAFIASNTNADASIHWISLPNDTRTKLAADLNCAGFDQCRDYAAGIRQSEIYLVMAWMIVAAIIHFGSGVTSMIVYYAITKHCYDMEEEIYGMADVEGYDVNYSSNSSSRRDSDAGWMPPNSYVNGSTSFRRSVDTDPTVPIILNGAESSLWRKSSDVVVSDVDDDGLKRIGDGRTNVTL